MKLFQDGMILHLLLHWAKSRENNGPKLMVSRLSVSAQVTFIKTGTYKGIRQVLIGVEIVYLQKITF